MQAKDISDISVVEAIRRLRTTDWPIVGGRPHGETRWVSIMELEQVFPSAPHKVVLAKARALIRKGLITGCACGCRGDFELTDAGEALQGAEAGKG